MAYLRLAAAYLVVAGSVVAWWALLDWALRRIKNIKASDDDED